MKKQLSVLINDDHVNYTVGEKGVTDIVMFNNNIQVIYKDKIRTFSNLPFEYVQEIQKEELQ